MASPARVAKRQIWYCTSCHRTFLLPAHAPWKVMGRIRFLLMSLSYQQLSSMLLGPNKRIFSIEMNLLFSILKQNFWCRDLHKWSTCGLWLFATPLFFYCNLFLRGESCAFYTCLFFPLFLYCQGDVLCIFTFKANHNLYSSSRLLW